MPTPARRPPPVSALDVALHRVGDRWSLLLVEALLGGPRRFGELLDDLDGLAPNILSNRLKALEAEGLLAARPYSDRAPPGGLRAHRQRGRAGRRAAPPRPVGRAARRRPRAAARRPAPRHVRHRGRGALVVPHLRPRRRRGGGPPARLGVRYDVLDERDVRDGRIVAPALVVVEASVGASTQLLAGPAIVRAPGPCRSSPRTSPDRRAGRSRAWRRSARGCAAASPESAPTRISANSSPPTRPTASEARTFRSRILREAAQRGVAGRVAVGVVERLELVEVVHHERHGRACCGGPAAARARAARRRPGG